MDKVDVRLAVVIFLVNQIGAVACTIGFDRDLRELDFFDKEVESGIQGHILKEFIIDIDTSAIQPLSIDNICNKCLEKNKNQPGDKETLGIKELEMVLS